MKDTPPRLEAPDDFRRFSIALDERLRCDAASALAPVGRMADGDTDHGWVRPDAVRALSHRSGDADWDAGFAAMCAFAGKHGWIADDGGIRAHIELIPAMRPVGADAFRNAMRKFASGVCVVASGQGSARRGMTVSAFTSVSADPPMVLVCLNRSASVHDAIVAAPSFSINILSGAQEDVARTFAGQSGLRGADRFADPVWQDDENGAPVLSTAHQSLICTPFSAQAAGTHTVLIGQVVATSDARDTSALVNYDGAINATTARPAVVQ
ncbi:flavin reductase family protein [Oceanicola sp. 22II-s10i]|uniref:flavin reductase family protein n=1 Tax=Oceanicola sp. 22II-s10i TaxID=1317116 RepID=UPI0020CBB03B|nr:flavin reductase family protein [Oceanicola sp. 22II-s10i]